MPFSLKNFLSILRFFSISVFSWVTVISALARDVWHGIRLVSIFCCKRGEVNLS